MSYTISISKTKKPKGLYQTQCQKCGILSALNTDKFQSKINVIQDGWIVKDSKWICPDCAKPKRRI